MKVIVFLLVIFLMTGVRVVYSNSSNAADLIFTHGNIITMDDALPRAEAVAVKGGKVVYVGTSQKVMELAGEYSEVIDLQGLTMIPGIHDAHIHALEAGSEVGGNCWLEAKSLKGLKPELLSCLRKQKGTDWLLAYGHQLETLLEGTEDPRGLLDSWVSDRPVAVMESTSHSIWVNSRALAAAGIKKNTKDPDGGIIMRYSDGVNAGEPNGILLETAGEMVFDLALQPNSTAAAINYEGLQWVMDELPQYGITSIADARVYWKRGWLEVWKKAEKNDDLTVRVNLGLWAYPNEEDERQIEFLKKQYRFDPERLMQINQIKIYSDGIIHNTTAALKEPYRLSLYGVPPTGLNYFDEQRLSKYIARLQPSGYDFHIHTIGDRGVHEALNAIEKNYPENPGHRHRLTHVEMIDNEDMPRFAKLNAIADMQVAGDYTLPENYHWQELYLGERAFHAYRLKDLNDSGAHYILSSDWTVNDLNPFVGIHNAVNRGHQSISVQQALKAYTLGAAYVMRSETRAGSIKTGKEADLVVIDQDILSIPPKAIKDTKVLLTLLSGEITYQSKAF
ncbi:amidohydrolase [Endozoicomonas atrinae]|uniref:amidohydrolase n=1 Tax=Endozoicomonas atrinae TaxID=1333660 RepID=UPI000824D9BC|nr:amidohydrolase [Endozoicomonas atrinae]